MTPNKPIQPPLNGVPALAAEQKPTAEPEPVCLIADHCHQCGRGVSRPHVANARVYCRGCCPSCARNANGNRI